MNFVYQNPRILGGGVDNLLNGPRVHSLSLESEAWVCLEETRLAKETDGVISHIFWTKLNCSLVFFLILTESRYEQSTSGGDNFLIIIYFLIIF